MLTRLTFSALFCAVVGLTPFASADNILDMKSTKWKFKDNVEGVADDWKTLKFDDAEWTTGTAPLGYGDEDTDAKESGKLKFGDDPQNKRTVAYLRHKVNVADPKAMKQVHGKFLCDDGCVIYINGKEAQRFNLPAGAITDESTAGVAMGGDLERDEMSFLAAPALFSAGENVIAIRLHQANPGSSDFAFDLLLKPLTDDDEIEEVKATVAEEKEAIESVLSGGGF